MKAVFGLAVLLKGVEDPLGSTYPIWELLD